MIEVSLSITHSELQFTDIEDITFFLDDIHDEYMLEYIDLYDEHIMADKILGKTKELIEGSESGLKTITTWDSLESYQAYRRSDFYQALKGQLLEAGFSTHVEVYEIVDNEMEFIPIEDPKNTPN